MSTFSWTKFWVGGLFLGVVLFLVGGQWVMSKVNYMLPAMEANFTQIFLKNTLASLTTIYLGLIFCYLELKIFTMVPVETYSFLESLTEPLYKILGAWQSKYKELKPFYRSCFFYLSFVPNLSLFMNGLILGFLILQPRLLLPHGLLEVPAMLASAKIAFSIKEEMEGPIRTANLALLKKAMRGEIGTKRLANVIVVQLSLLIAAYVEVNYAF